MGFRGFLRVVSGVPPMVRSPRNEHHGIMNISQNSPEQHDNAEQPPVSGIRLEKSGASSASDAKDDAGPEQFGAEGAPAGAGAGYGAAPTLTQAPATESARFFQWLRGLGIRRSSRRWMGGVCGGLADKWGIDPAIVRGLAVVLTLFMGIGVLAYGVAWALLPEPDGRIHVEGVAHSRWTAGMTGAGLMTLLGLTSFGQGIIWGIDGDFGGWAVFWILATAGVVYWAVTSNKRPAPGPQQAVPPNYTAPPATMEQQHTAPLPPYAPAQYVKSPVKRTPRLGAPATLLVLGAAAMAGAAVLLLDTTHVIDLNGYQAGVAIAAAAITAGLGIVAAGFMGRAAGGLGTFAVFALIFAGIFSLPHQQSPVTAFNNVNWSPTTSSSAEAGRSVAFGSGTFDLTELARPTAGADVVIPIEAFAANVTIKVPNDIPVTLNSQLAASALTVDGKDDSGGLAQETTTELNRTAKGPGLVINLDGAASNIDIEVVSAP